MPPKPQSSTAEHARATRPSADATRERILAAAARPVRRPVLRRRDHPGDRGPGRRVAAVARLPLPHQGRALAGGGRRGSSASSGTALRARVDGLRGVDLVTTAKLVVRDFIAFSAAHPQLHRIITQESKGEGERIDWLVDEHIRPLYEITTACSSGLVEAGAVPDVPAPFLYYILTGAGPTIFVLAPECKPPRRLRPPEPDAVQTHADAVIGLLFRDA